jgi:hypothetical protein
MQMDFKTGDSIEFWCSGTDDTGVPEVMRRTGLNM